MIIKQKIRAVIFALALVLIAGVAVVAGGTGITQAHADSGLKIAVLSDTHYYPASYMGTNKDFTAAAASRNNMMVESGALLDKALELIKADAPDVLLITGDITNNGEDKGHKDVALKLKNFEAATGIKAYVINGNNDVNSESAFRYSNGRPETVSTTNQSQFKDIYAEFGYKEAVAKYTPKKDTFSGGLSYAVRPREGYTLIAVDTNKYTSDVTSSGKNEPEIGGAISADLLSWIKAQSKEAVKRGDAVIVFQHHSAVSIFDTESLYGGVLLSGSDAVATAYADAKIELVFSSHMQANDIATFTSESGKTIYDVQTAGIAAYPCSYRLCNLSSAKTDKKVDITTQIETKYIESLTYTHPLTNTSVTIEDMTEYSMNATALTNESVKPIAKTLIKNLLTGVMDDDGVIPLIKGYLNATTQTNEEMVATLLTTYLSTDSDNPEAGEGYSAYYDITNKRINLAVSVMEQEGIIYIHDRDTATTIENLSAEIENRYIKDPSLILAQLDGFVEKLMAYQFDGVDQPFEEILNFAYLGFLMGDEKNNEEGNEWVETFLDLFKENEFSTINGLIDVLIKPILLIVAEDIMANIPIDLRTLLHDGDVNGKSLINSIIGRLPEKVTINQLIGIASIFGAKIEFSSEQLLDEFLMPMLLNDKNKNTLNAEIYNLIHTMVYDPCYEEDNSTTFMISGHIAEKRCGCGTINLSSFLIFFGALALSSLLLLKTKRKKVCRQ